jgi:hypothetical protein
MGSRGSPIIPDSAHKKVCAKLTKLTVLTKLTALKLLNEPRVPTRSVGRLASGGETMEATARRTRG